MATVVHARALRPDDEPESQEAIHKSVGDLTNPRDTPIFICTLSSSGLESSSLCYRLFPSEQKLRAHRAKDHAATDTGQPLDGNQVISWSNPLHTTQQHNAAAGAPTLEQPQPVSEPASAPQLLEQPIASPSPES